MMFLRRDKLKKVSAPDVYPGADVLTADGAVLGTVKEVSDISFKVDARLAPDFWLGRDYVLESTAERVVMSFDRDHLEAYKLGSKGTPEDEASQRALVETPFSEEEQLDQRIRMERELAQQRQRLSHEHPEGEAAPPDTGGTLGQPVEEELREYGVEPLGAAPESRVSTPTGDVVGDTLVEREAEYEEERAATDERLSASGVEYSIPTRHRAHDPAAAREREAMAGVAVIGGTILAAVSGFLLLLRRRGRRKTAG